MNNNFEALIKNRSNHKATNINYHVKEQEEEREKRGDLERVDLSRLSEAKSGTSNRVSHPELSSTKQQWWWW